MGVDAHAQVPHDTLADDGAEVGLPDTDDPTDDWRKDHQTDVQIEQAEVSAANGAVDDQFQQDWVDEPDGGRRQDCDHDEQYVRAIRPENSGHAPQRARVLRARALRPLLIKARRPDRATKPPHSPHTHRQRYTSGSNKYLTNCNWQVRSKALPVRLGTAW